MTNRVFVYGSMTEGMVHFSRIQSSILSAQNASVFGAAYRLKVGYPILLKGDHDQVPGQLVQLKSPDLMLGLLDEFYGYSNFEPQKSLHMREKAAAHLEDGQTIECWAYFLNPKKLPAGASKISGIEWESALLAPKFLDNLTERQINYIRKLGAITGREVVPIDLPLYRELMNLELIVDKGRRLALSKFGQEVYRYLGET